MDMLRLRVDAAGVVVSGVGTYPADGNELVFVAVSYDGTKTSSNVLFYRGTAATSLSLVSTVTLNEGTVDTFPGRLAVGGRSGFNGPRTFHGIMDNVRIFGSKTDATGALSLAEIDEVFQGDFTEEVPAGTVILIR